MDPKLVAAIREFMKKHKELGGQGVEITPEHIEEFFRERTGGKFGTEDAQKLVKGVDTSVNLRNQVRSGVQGALFNFGDEVLGALGGKEKAEEMRLREDLFREAHPRDDLIAQILGGILVPGLGTAKVVGKGLSVGKAVLTGSAFAGGSAAVAGAGAGETAEERLSKALKSLGIGSLIGVVPPLVGAAPAAARGMARVFSPQARATNRLTKAIEESGGIDAVQAQNDLMAATGRSGEATLGTLTDPLAGQLDFAANANPATHRAVAQGAARQAEGMGGRLIDDVSASAGNPVASQRLAALEKSRRDWAKGPTAYGGLREKNKVLFQNDKFMGRMQGLIMQDEVQKVWQKARDNQLIGPMPELSTPSFEMVQEVVTDLGDAARVAYRKGQGSLGKRLDDTSEFIRAELRVAVPGYRGVDAAYARRIRMEKALESGEEWFRKQGRVSELRDEWKKFSPAEKQEFRTGLVSELVGQLENAQTNRNVAQQIMNGSSLLDEKLKIVFGSPAQFEGFMAAVEAEAKMLGRARTAAGGSPTVRRGLEAIDPAQVATSVAGGLAAGGANAAAGALGSVLARRAPGAMARGTASQLGPMLLTRGHIEIDDLLESLRRRQTVGGVPPWLTAGAPTVTGGLLGGR